MAQDTYVGPWRGRWRWAGKGKRTEQHSRAEFLISSVCSVVVRRLWSSRLLDTVPVSPPARAPACYLSGTNLALGLGPAERAHLPEASRRSTEAS